MIIDANDERPRPRMGDAPPPPVQDDAAERPKRAPRAKKVESAKNPPPWKLLGWSLAGILGLVLVLWIGTRVDDFLATDARFAIAAPAEVGEVSPNLQITGLKRSNQEEILKIFAGDIGKSIYLVPLAERRERLMKVDWIRDASVLRIWPNRLQVHLTERVPVASLHLPPTPRDTERGKEFHLALIDGEGTILTPYGEARAPAPVMTGITAETPIEDRKVRVQRVMKLMREAGIYRERIARVDAFDVNNLRLSQPFMEREIVLLLGHEKFFARLDKYFTNLEKLPTDPRIPGFDLQPENEIVSLSVAAKGANE
ncbi:MAG: FtsQ-type POTRA domain-containing protein [Bryobacteraceae bacterium]|nr:FtsQ-type POTRA domain-containing protein [Bryobacteraceae bacterium]